MLKKILYAGISEDISDLKTKANYFKNRILIIAFLAALFFILQTYFNPMATANVKYKAYLFNGIPMLCYTIAIIVSFRQKHLLSKLLLLIAAITQIVAAALLVDTIFLFYLLIVCLFPFTIFIVEKRLKYFFSVFTILILVVVEVYFNLYNIKTLLPQMQITIGIITFVIVAPVILVLIINDLQNTNIRIEQSLNQEREKSDRLLMNILPQKTSEEIKAGKKIIADDYEDASVLFADIVGFTDTTTNISAKRVVNELNKVFWFIDNLIEEYGLEKIKTIGDSYMVASGVPEVNSRHLDNIIDFALDLLDRVKEIRFIDQELKLRIGINSGPLVAGVLGKRKYIYDIWGETVNIASRMESTGIEDKIQISESLYYLIRDKYKCEERGEVFIKGKGYINTYFVLKKVCDDKRTSPISSISGPVSTNTKGVLYDEQQAKRN